LSKEGHTKEAKGVSGFKSPPKTRQKCNPKDQKSIFCSLQLPKC